MPRQLPSYSYKPDKSKQEKQSSQSPETEPDSVLESEKHLSQINEKLSRLDDMVREIKQQTRVMKTISRRVDIIAVIIPVFFLLAVLYSCSDSLSIYGNLP
jgi:hypothetical protein